MNIEHSNEIPTNKLVALQINKTSMIGKIVGGRPVLMKHFPSMVQLYNLGNMCAGNILNSWTVLTAAHCFDYNQNVKEIVIQVVLHHKYNETLNFACDIAMVFLSRSIRFTKNSKKGILATDATWMSRGEKNFTVTGWGWTKKGLMMTYLRFIPNDECGRLHDLTLTRDMFCLYGEGTRDTCKGDSGGGVLWHGNSREVTKKLTSGTTYFPVIPDSRVLGTKP
ncbi:Serine protease 1 [Operophtera brumata]|uniref:Serine protease 1 n=1 Tax=Operophtera brumata TaxID=104452 RepID=A0A0L7LH96_OPEBR|nr:Serine protease 1 [Operophtera brumata]